LARWKLLAATQRLPVAEAAEAPEAHHPPVRWHILQSTNAGSYHLIHVVQGKGVQPVTGIV